MNASLASVSNHLFTVTLLIYAGAMFAFALHAAFGRPRRVAASATRVPAQLHVRDAELVVVGAGQVLVSPEPPRPRTATTADPPAAVPAVPRVAVALTGLGWTVHAAEVLTRGLAAGRVPWGNMYEFSSAVCLVAVGVFLVLLARGHAAQIGLYVLLPVVCYLGLAGTVLYTAAAPLQPVLNSYWLKIHVLAALTATGTFMVGGVVTAMLVLRRRLDKRTGDGPPPSRGIARSLPAAATLDRLEHRIIMFAFPIWTFAVVAGAIWAESAWGRYWGWDPKETWSFITWVIYAGYLHARATTSLRRFTTPIALTGFAALVVNYYVVNLIINGLHSYAGV
jgi:cytochrome c-type biogenesis protein CcsB